MSLGVATAFTLGAMLNGVLCWQLGRWSVLLLHGRRWKPTRIRRAWQYLAVWELPGDIRWLAGTWRRYLTGG